MRRDMDLIRRILQHIEEHDSVRFEGAETEEIEYHARLLEDGGLITGFSRKKLASAYQVQAPRLTWLGHEFLDLARSQERWDRATSAVNAASGASFEIWRRYLDDLADQEVRKK